MSNTPKLPLRVRRLQDATRKIERLEKRRDVAIAMLVRVETTLPKLRAQRKRLSALVLTDAGAKASLQAHEVAETPPKAPPVLPEHQGDKRSRTERRLAGETLPPPITPEAVRKAKEKRMKAMGFRPNARRGRAAPAPRDASAPRPDERRPD